MRTILKFGMVIVAMVTLSVCMTLPALALAVDSAGGGYNAPVITVTGLDNAIINNANSEAIIPATVVFASPPNINAVNSTTAKNSPIMITVANQNYNTATIAKSAYGVIGVGAAFNTSQQATVVAVNYPARDVITATTVINNSPPLATTTANQNNDAEFVASANFNDTGAVLVNASLQQATVAKTVDYSARDVIMATTASVSFVFCVNDAPWAVTFTGPSGPPLATTTIVGMVYIS